MIIATARVHSLSQGIYDYEPHPPTQELRHQLVLQSIIPMFLFNEHQFKVEESELREVGFPSWFLRVREDKRPEQAISSAQVNRTLHTVLTTTTSGLNVQESSEQYKSVAERSHTKLACMVEGELGNEAIRVSSIMVAATEVVTNDVY